MLSIRFLLDVVAPSVLLCWAAILISNAAVGESGFRALSLLDTEADELSAEVDTLRTRRLALEKRANQLNSKSLDPDLVDERIRAILGYSQEGDIVVTREQLERALKR